MILFRDRGLENNRTALMILQSVVLCYFVGVKMSHFLSGYAFCIFDMGVNVLSLAEIIRSRKIT